MVEKKDSISSVSGTPHDAGLYYENNPIALPNGREKVQLGSGVVTKILGKGGMAAVYEIWNQHLEIHRAVKLMSPYSSTTDRQRFNTEIKISAKLFHPNIVAIHSDGEWQGLPFIEMERIEGVGCDRLMAQRGALPAPICTAIAIQISRALNYAHNQDCTIYGREYHGVIHRDLKPQNIMITGSGIVKLMDFGIARPPQASFHTVDNSVLGTLPYLSPEQLMTSQVDVRTDIYALGVVMYEMVTGTVAFPQKELPSLIECKSRNKYESLEAFGLQIPLPLKRIIHRCMHYNPDKRIPSAAILLDELEKIQLTLTDQNPEKVLAAYVASDPETKIIYNTYRRTLQRKITIYLGIAGLIMVLVPLLWTKYHSQKEYQKNYSQNQFDNIFSLETMIPDQLQEALPDSTRDSTTNKKRPAPDTPSSTKAVETIKKIPVQKPTLLEELEQKYTTDDLLAIMEKELQSNNTQSALSVYKALPSYLAQSPYALILYLRALEKAGDKKQLESTLASLTLNDGEVFLARAKIAYNAKNYAESKKLIEVSLTLPHEYLDFNDFKRDSYYWSALCSTALFDANPSEETYKAATTAWWLLKSELRQKPGHQYNTIATAQMQRMAIKMRSLKG
jgi:serine/threonine protein kinase